MREGEIIGLHPEDIDFSGGFIDVRRAIVKGRVTTPKSGKQRKVDMSHQLTEALKAHLHETKKETLRKGWKETPKWLFYNEMGNHLDPDHLRKRYFYKCLDKAGLRRIRFHDLRHTYASLLLSQGESLAYVRDQLGHSNIGTTVDTYGHLVPGANRDAVNRLDDPQPGATNLQPGVSAHKKST
jgi:integrase